MQDTSYPYPQSNPDWFTGAPQAGPPKRNKRLLYGGIAILMGLLIIGGIIITVNILTRPACLSAADYQDLTGVPHTDTLQPTTSFYTIPVDFSDKAVLTTAGKAEIRSLASFYQKHAAKSLQLTINGTYSPADQKADATARTLALQQALTDAGIPADRIATNQPEFIAPEEDDAAPTQSFTISITSLEGCR